MSKSKHTPGPWLVAGSTVYALNDEQFPANRFSAQVSSGWVDEVQRISNNEIMANARLMGAAPDLLEALEELIAQTGITGTFAEKTFAAIAKAKGE